MSARKPVASLPQLRLLPGQIFRAAQAVSGDAAFVQLIQRGGEHLGEGGLVGGVGVLARQCCEEGRVHLPEASDHRLYGLYQGLPVFDLQRIGRDQGLADGEVALARTLVGPSRSAMRMPPGWAVTMDSISSRSSIDVARGIGRVFRGRSCM